MIRGRLWTLMRKIIGTCVDLLINCLLNKTSEQKGRDYLSSKWYRNSVYCNSWGISISWTVGFDLFERHSLRWVGLNSINGYRYKPSLGASLVAQWLRICLPMQGTRVRALVWADPTCRGATGPVSHNYWACASGACAPQQERLWWWEARAPRWRVAPACHN